MNVQDVIAYIVFVLIVVVNVISLILLWKRRAKQPLKSRCPLWLGISLVSSTSLLYFRTVVNILGQLQLSLHLWNIVGLAECHLSRVFLAVSYCGYMLCLIIRCWKLHFAFNINKAKLLAPNYQSWFKKHKYYVSESFLVPVFCGFCVFLSLLGFVFVSIDPTNQWILLYPPCDFPLVPDLLVTALLFFVCVIVLIVFCALLYRIEDGFRISLELKLSIVLMLVFYTLCLVLSNIASQMFDNSGVDSRWIVIVPQLVSQFMAVYWPIYQSFTVVWLERVDSLSRVSMKELVDMQHFLHSIAGFGPFLRFLHTEFCAELLFLWRDIEDFNKELDDSERRTKATGIMEEYFNVDGNMYIAEWEPFKSGLLVHLEEEIIFGELKVLLEKQLHAKFYRFMTSKFYSQYACGVTIIESLENLGLQ